MAKSNQNFNALVNEATNYNLKNSNGKRKNKFAKNSKYRANSRDRMTFESSKWN